jgi:hypothetical protein
MAEKDDVETILDELELDRTRPTWVNFYELGNASCHFTRDGADEMARSLRGSNARVACIEVDAVIGEGLSDEESW